ncbi:hypothetical protein SLA2020_262810 [Shorea laevis]
MVIFSLNNLCAAQLKEEEVGSVSVRRVPTMQSSTHSLIAWKSYLSKVVAGYRPPPDHTWLSRPSRSFKKLGPSNHQDSFPNMKTSSSDC